jgi:hypothetical protein
VKQWQYPVPELSLAAIEAVAVPGSGAVAASIAAFESAGSTRFRSCQYLRCWSGLSGPLLDLVGLVIPRQC